MSQSNPLAADYDVVIAGGGMVGSALAAALARGKFTLCVLEKSLPPPFNPDSPPDIRVSAVNLASEQLLQSWGAWPFMAAQRIHPYSRLAVWEKLQQPLRFPGFAGDLNRTEFSCRELGTLWLGHIIENLVIQRALLAVLAQYDNVDIISGAQVKDLQCRGESGGTIVLEDGRRFNGKLLVGADGALSKVRELACLGVREDAYHQHAFVLAVEYAGTAQDITWQAFRPHGPLAFLPLASIGQRHYASLVWYDHPDRITELMKLEDRVLLAAIAQEYPDSLPALLRITQKAHFPLVKRHAKGYTAPGIALVGDAAHTINPLAGQGVNLGFQDVAALASSLADGRRKGYLPGSMATLSHYENQRRLQNLMMMTLMDGFYYAFSNDIKPLKLARNIGLSLAGRLLPAKRKVLEYATGLSQLPG
jgi:2-octaprenyl-3-methyl-6-methoxy-1,4-benzoquinol hydroxylase